jgi:hypothetical protein
MVAETPTHARALATKLSATELALRLKREARRMDAQRLRGEPVFTATAIGLMREASTRILALQAEARLDR